MMDSEENFKRVYLYRKTVFKRCKGTNITWCDWDWFESRFSNGGLQELYGKSWYAGHTKETGGCLNNKIVSDLDDFPILDIENKLVKALKKIVSRGKETMKIKASSRTW